MSHATLQTLAASTRKRLAAAQAARPLADLREAAQSCAGDVCEEDSFVFEKALAKEGYAFICEIKRASPSRGIIAQDFPYLSIAKDYEAAGAAAISVLTEPDYFLGSDRYLSEIAQEVSLPLLRKDFILDPYQIYEAKVLGAKAVLLIVALLDKADVAGYIRLADSLGLSCLVEVHTTDEVELAVDAGARVIGINNRDLHTFCVDLDTTKRLRYHIPKGIVAVSESGIQSPADIQSLASYQLDAFLIGESLMRAPCKRAYLQALRSGAVLEGRPERARKAQGA
ncbi:MAG: indole-3-glycerol phosphate synthase TrpC [Treponema sp.]|jgi:indole-3-glycerol phosphate synthase|nr:indole-3-glycerol phosphate synthase TrpC [Treponema sp.]